MPALFVSYQWEEPFVADDRRCREHFGVMPVDREAAARATLEWAMKEYGGR